MNKIYFIFLSTIFISSCSEVKVVLPEPVLPSGEKVILIEEVTGVRCSNCPAATSKLDEIAAAFDNRVIIVGIHGTQQTEPYDNSKYNFSNDDAKKLEEYLKPWIGKPAAAFNRIHFDDQESFSLSNIALYQGKVEQVLETEELIAINTIKSYNSESRLLELTVEITALKDINHKLNVSIMVTESHIVDVQLDAIFGGINEEYEHNHVLRDMITNFTGDPLTENMSKGEKIPKKWTYTIPNRDDGLWIEENLEIIVFVNRNDSESKEILQAKSFYIVE